MKTPIAILASGSGTTAEAFIRSMQTEDYDFTVPLVITNNPSAGVLERVRQLNESLGLAIEAQIISSKTHPAVAGETILPGYQTTAEQTAILAALHTHHIGLVLLLGYMKHVGDRIVDEYGWLPGNDIHQARMLNTHPGLLPATKGLFGIHVQETVLHQQTPQAGQTLHVVGAGYDEGPVVFEHPVEVQLGETAEALFARVQLVEKAHIAADVAQFIADQAQYNESKEERP